MGQVIADTLPYAEGVAISPMPIIVVILMLISARARSNGLAFLVGWAGGLAVVGGVVFLVSEVASLSVGGGTSLLGPGIKLLLGLLFFFLAYMEWRKRPKPGEEPEMPKWAESIDSFTPLVALGIAVLMGGLSPKNLSLTLAAALTIAEADLEGVQTVIGLGTFILLASLTVAVPVLYDLLAGDRAEETLKGWHTWLSANSATVMFILFLIFGMVLLGKGIGGLSG
jgi:hypothetical protein